MKHKESLREIGRLNAIIDIVIDDGPLRILNIINILRILNIGPLFR